MIPCSSHTHHKIAFQQQHFQPNRLHDFFVNLSTKGQAVNVGDDRLCQGVQEQLVGVLTSFGREAELCLKNHDLFFFVNARQVKFRIDRFGFLHEKFSKKIFLF
jgi:hypothetical protein